MLNQKFLIVNNTFIFSFNKFLNQYVYNVDNEYEKEQIVNEDINYFTLKQIYFNDIIILFHVKAFRIKNFNNEIYSRYDITFIFRNICKINCYDYIIS